MAVHCDQQHRHVRPQEKGDEQREGKRRQPALRDRDRTHGSQQFHLAAFQARECEEQLMQREGRGEPEGDKTGFGDQGFTFS